MATEATGSLPVEVKSSANSSTSAPPMTSATVTDEPTSGRSLFDPLDEAKHSLLEQSDVSAQLHPLNSSLQSLYSASSCDGRLSREQYRQLISQIRHSVSQFAANTPALKSQLLNSATTSAEQPDNVATANQLRRYISLLTETSTHTAALAHSIAPITSADRQRSHDNAQQGSAPPFPQRLQAGAFRRGSFKQPTSSWDCALETLGALCETLETTSKSLGLETFSEPSEDATVVPSDTTSTDVLTHTLTLGAKILVIDVEFLIVKHCEMQSFRPKSKLKISYAIDSAESQQVRDPRLAAVLERDIQTIADKLFGPAGAYQQDRSLVAAALANWTNNLKELLILDNLEAKATEAAPEVTRPMDLFAAMQELCSAAARISDAEASSSTSAVLFDRGHGIHKLHESQPFLRSVFAQDPTSKQVYTLSLNIQALDLPVQPAVDMIAPSFPLSQAAQDLLASSTLDPAKSLGSVPSSTDSKKRVPLYFVARLSPPVVVTRPTAAKLASICNLRHTASHNTTATGSGLAPAVATWFEDVLASSWSRRPQQPVDDSCKPSRCTFVLAQTVESVRSTESQGLIVDSLPLLSASTSSGDTLDESDAPRTEPSTLARLFAAIEILRDEIKITELMHSAISSSEKAHSAEGGQIAADELSLDDVLSSAKDEPSGKIPVTLAFRMPIRGATDEARQSLSLELGFRVAAESGADIVFDASISLSKRTPEVGWSLSAEAKSTSLAGTTSKTARLDSSSSQAQSIVAKLSNLDSLEDVVLDLVDWAKKDLDLHQKKPSASQSSQALFDPLSYEQQNVHAIYETIAPHFSSTRYKPWPLIPAFLSTIPAGSFGADLGCGNGKYLPIRSTLAFQRNAPDIEEQDLAAKHQNSLLTVGVDRSSNLISLARDNFGMLDNSDATKTKSNSEVNEGELKRRQEVAVGDAIQSSLRTGLFDYAISIATIHHFSTWERRRASVQELIRIVAPTEADSTLRNNVSEASTDPRLEGSFGRGRFMIFVWALEQKDEGKRQFEASNPELLKCQPEIEDPNHVKSKDRLVSYSGLQATGQAGKKETKVTDDQDVLVPWVLTASSNKKAKASKPPNASKGKNKKIKGGDADTQGLETDMAQMKVKPPQAEEPKKTDGEGAGEEARPVYNRYYHMFRAGELESLVADAGAMMPAVHRRNGRLEQIDVVREASGWERGNWWGVWRVQWRH
ncbi:uncharacterized protein MEPE_05123 [Melanopsichium pennsylvanicum]|uniref:Mediator of RNA polymerase II transcription subunit 1 n=2 Tax=Melanopsichium pennsylvanicum TaxID=63383 RepID=A0AAJ5C7E0_9BASI|nr:uncharacterized protein MEPE_05123 [Melanopsichium pennsylvanicum]